MKPTVIDLFSGAGGTSLGFVRARFQILAAVEIDRSAAKTYEDNLGIDVLKEDIRRVSPVALRKGLKLRQGQLDVLAGCPPCQGFSAIRNDSGAGDARNGLVLRYLAFVNEFRPKYAVFENVPGLIRTSHGKVFYTKLIEGLHANGYRVSRYLVDCADFGVPQHRQRVVIIAARARVRIPLLMRSHTDPDSGDAAGLMPWITVRDAIEKYPPLVAGERHESVPNHIAPRTGMRKDSARLAAFIRMVPKDGGSRWEVPREHWLACHKKMDGFRDVYGRLRWDAPAGTLTSGCTNPSKGRFLHPVQQRGLSFREAAALQGFPDNWIFHGVGIATQVGNAVPPQLAEAIAKGIRRALRSKQHLQPKSAHILPRLDDVGELQYR